MRKIFYIFLISLILASLFSISYAKVVVVNLPEPNKTGGMPLNEAVTNRHTEREFTDYKIKPQELSDLLYVAAGVNRENNLRVYPVGKGVQDMFVYVFDKEGVYKFDAPTHSLELIIEGDHRQDTGTPTYIGRAAVNLVYVQDIKLWDSQDKTRETVERWGFAHTGAIMQNVYLFAASKGWNSVARGSFNETKIRELLNLDKNHIITLVQSIGPGSDL